MIAIYPSSIHALAPSPAMIGGAKTKKKRHSGDKQVQMYSTSPQLAMGIASPVGTRPVGVRDVITGLAHTTRNRPERVVLIARPLRRGLMSGPRYAVKGWRLHAMIVVSCKKNDACPSEVKSLIAIRQVQVIRSHPATVHQSPASKPSPSSSVFHQISVSGVCADANNPRASKRKYPSSDSKSNL